MDNHLVIVDKHPKPVDNIRYNSGKNLQNRLKNKDNTAFSVEKTGNVAKKGRFTCG